MVVTVDVGVTVCVGVNWVCLKVLEGVGVIVGEGVGESVGYGLSTQSGQSTYVLVIDSSSYIEFHVINSVISKHNCSPEM